VSEH